MYSPRRDPQSIPENQANGGHKTCTTQDAAPIRMNSEPTTTNRRRLRRRHALDRSRYICVADPPAREVSRAFDVPFPTWFAS